MKKIMKILKILFLNPIFKIFENHSSTLWILDESRHTIHEYKKQVENMTTEIRSLRDQNGNLKRQLDDDDQAHRREIDDYGKVF